MNFDNTNRGALFKKLRKDAIEASIASHRVCHKGRSKSARA